MTASVSTPVGQLTPSWRWRRDLAIVIGMTCCIQFALYGSSFVGRSVLLPVQILTLPTIYQSQTLDRQPMPCYVRSDLVQVSEPHRWFITAEYRAGRIPFWTPYAFCGTPFARAPIFSPFELLCVLWPGPGVLPWMQLLSALVAATGAWLFAARLIGLSSLAAITAGVAYPLTGFLVLWQGFETIYPVALFPWQAVAALRLIGHPSAMRVIVLALTTTLTIASGPADMAGQVLLATGMIWVWNAGTRLIASGQLRPVMLSAAATTAGWAIGFLLVAPLLLPYAEYLQTSARAAARSVGFEARPPVGLKALPLVAFPEAYGTDRDNTAFVLAGSGNQLESAAGSYCGCVALLFALPWAWRDRSRRSWIWCFTILAILGLSWQLNMPGLVEMWRLPGLKMLSANRLVFLTAWSTLMLATIGLEQIAQHCSERFSWSVGWGGLATIVCLVGCLAGFVLWPEELKSVLPQGLRGMSLVQLQANFEEQYWHQLGWFVACLCCWATVYLGFAGKKTFPWIVGSLMVLDLVAHVWNVHPQPDPKLYYPRIPALEFIRQSPPGRVIGMGCLPPKLLESHQLSDVRGYDGVDPLPVIDVLKISASAKMDPSLYAQTMWYAPTVYPGSPADGSFRLHPTLDMLGLRYLVFAGSKVAFPEWMPGAAFQENGYTVFINKHALPRAWVPDRVTKRASDAAVLRSMEPRGFAPAKEAFVTTLTEQLPNNCSGDVELIAETPQKMSLSATMRTPGLVVIGDRFDLNWKATVDGQPVPMLCVNYMLRGVVLPEGLHTIELRYYPAAFVRGGKLFLLGTSILFAIGVWHCRKLLLRKASETVP